MMTTGVWGQRPQQADSQCCRYGCELASTRAGGTANSLYDIRREGRERKEVFVRNVMSARVSDWLADSYYVSHKLERLSAKQKTRRGWLQPPDWSAKSKISTRWLCLRLVSSKRCQQSKKLDAAGSSHQIGQQNAKSRRAGSASD